MAGIPGRGGWGTGIVTKGLPMRPLTLEVESHPGAMDIAEVDARPGTTITAISIYGLLESRTINGKTTLPYVTTTMQRMLSDLNFLLLDHYGKRSIVMGGDTNISTQLQPPWTAHHQAVLDRISAFGLVDCLGKFHVGHVQTQRHPHSHIPCKTTTSTPTSGLLLARCAASRSMRSAFGLSVSTVRSCSSWT